MSVFSKNVGDDAFNFEQKVSSYISKSWAVEEKEEIPINTSTNKYQ